MTLLFQATDAVGTAAGVLSQNITGNIGWLLLGIAFFLIAAAVVFFLKNIIVNTVLGLAGWGILTFFFHLQIPFWPSLIASAVFGLAGIGGMVIAAYFGIVG